MPVYIVSKGRAGRIVMMDRISAARVVVAEADFAEYEAAYPGRVVIGAQGVGPNRQALLDHAARNGEKRIWMADDDILGLYTRDEERMRYGSNEQDWPAVLEQIEARSANGPAMVGLCHRHIGWAEPVEQYNRHVGNFVLMYTGLPASYWPLLAEDLDYELQLWTQGFRTLLLAHWAMSVPQTGSNDGGLHGEYRAGKWADAVFALEVRWPGLVRARSGGSWGIRPSVDFRGLRDGLWAGVKPMEVQS